MGRFLEFLIWFLIFYALFSLLFIPGGAGLLLYFLLMGLFIVPLMILPMVFIYLLGVAVEEKKE